MYRHPCVREMLICIVLGGANMNRYPGVREVLI